MLAVLDATTAAGFLKDVDPLWRAFWFHMHLMAKNLPEFAEGLDAISDDIYDYHVSGHKNEIARWVQEVIGDGELGRALMDVPDRKAAAQIVRTRIAELKAIVAAAPPAIPAPPVIPA